MDCDTTTTNATGSSFNCVIYAKVLRGARKHCGNRTHRLRSSLKMTHGKGREFKKLPPLKLDAIKDGQ